MNKQSERGSAVLEFAVIAGLIALIAYGMHLQAANGHDIFTAMWQFVQSIH